MSSCFICFFLEDLKDIILKRADFIPFMSTWKLVFINSNYVGLWVYCGLYGNSIIEHSCAYARGSYTSLSLCPSVRPSICDWTKIHVSIQGNSGPVVLHKCLAIATCMRSKSKWVCLLFTTRIPFWGTIDSGLLGPLGHKIQICSGYVFNEAAKMHIQTDGTCQQDYNTSMLR